jgi:CRISPR-associated protein Csm3
MSTSRKLVKKIVYQYEMELITGLRIGDSKENVEIGGVDAPVVRRKDNQEPYIPGSSIKGKIRCLLELAKGINADSKCENTGEIIQELFGGAENKSSKMLGIPSRLIVRDAYLTSESSEKLRNSEFTDMPYTEIKAENKINRLTGTAESPRFFERIPAGTKFNVEFVINIFEEDDKSTNNGETRKTLYENLLKEGIRLLELDYLGRSGSRGYGQVKFELKKTIENKISINGNGTLEIKPNNGNNSHENS